MPKLLRQESQTPSHHLQPLHHSQQSCKTNSLQIKNRKFHSTYNWWPSDWCTESTRIRLRMWNLPSIASSKTQSTQFRNMASWKRWPLLTAHGNDPFSKTDKYFQRRTAWKEEPAQFKTHNTKQRKSYDSPFPTKLQTSTWRVSEEGAWGFPRPRIILLLRRSHQKSQAVNQSLFRKWSIKNPKRKRKRETNAEADTTRGRRTVGAWPVIYLTAHGWSLVAGGDEFPIKKLPAFCSYHSSQMREREGVCARFLLHEGSEPLTDGTSASPLLSAEFTSDFWYA